MNLNSTQAYLGQQYPQKDKLLYKTQHNTPKGHPLQAGGYIYEYKPMDNTTPEGQTGG